MHAFGAALLIVLLAGAGPTEIAQRRAAALAKRAFHAINAQRVQAGLQPLQWDERLAAAARDHAFNMAGRGFFAHEDPELGGTGRRLKARGYEWSVCAENIFNEQGYPDPVERAVEGWMSSLPHRRNIMNPALTHSGIGVASTGDDRFYFVQIFALPRPELKPGRESSSSWIGGRRPSQRSSTR